MITTLIVVEDISGLVDLKEGESPLYVETYHQDQREDDLEELGVAIAEHASRGEFYIPAWGYTDVSGEGEIVPVGIHRVIDTKAIVMFIEI